MLTQCLDAAGLAGTSYLPCLVPWALLGAFGALLGLLVIALAIGAFGGRFDKRADHTRISQGKGKSTMETFANHDAEEGTYGDG